MHPISKLPDLTQDEWEALFRFANKWGFDNLEQHCLNEMKKLDWDPWKQLAFCLEFDVPYTWAHRAFVVLCQKWDSKSSMLQAVKVGGWPLFAIVAHINQAHLRVNALTGTRHVFGGPTHFVAWRSDHPTVEQLTIWISQVEEAAREAA